MMDTKQRKLLVATLVGVVGGLLIGLGCYWFLYLVYMSVG